MIFYIARDENGRRQLRGTQADAKAVNRNFEQIDIPTDKAGLMTFVQALYAEIDSVLVCPNDDEHASCDDCRQPPAVALNRGGVEECGFLPEPSYVHQSVRFEDEFDNMPLATQLHYAARAMENARERL